MVVGHLLPRSEEPRDRAATPEVEAEPDFEQAIAPRKARAGGATPMNRGP